MAANRFFDVMVSAAALICLSPVLLVLAAFVKLTSRGSVFYVAERVGKDGRLFRLLKFRTMHENTAAVGPGITRKNDPRVTPVGRWLRRLKFDELPQLFNVMKGDMSLVGPRPEDARYVARYSDEQRKILTVRPGLTSMASLKYRDEESMLKGDNWEDTYLTVIMPDKLRLDIDYLEHRTFCADLGIIWQTFRTLFLRGRTG